MPSITEPWKEECEVNTTPMRSSYEDEIVKALLGAPNHSMSVNELYDWFERNSAVMGNKEVKNWHNRIRHELCTKKV